MPLSAFEDHFGENTYLKSLGESRHRDSLPPLQPFQLDHGCPHSPGRGAGWQAAGRQNSAGGPRGRQAPAPESHPTLCGATGSLPRQHGPRPLQTQQKTAPADIARS